MMPPGFCWCGDDAQMFESTTGPFGPYTAANDLINCSTPDYNPDRNCGGPQTPQRGPGAQQFGVYNIPLANNVTGCTIRSRLDHDQIT